LFGVAGCASVPARESLPVYNLNGTSYYSLSALCKLRGVSLEYDIFTHKAVLYKEGHTVSLMVGDNLVLADNRAVIFDHSADLYNGMVVVPERFKSGVFDQLFRPAKKDKFVARPATRVCAYIKKVVVDAGHGGHDPGAVGRTGLKEKDVNLDIAKRLANRLRLEGVTVVMTRSTDKFIPLGERVHIANAAKADLFISIHANANRSRSVHGFEVYYVSPSVNDANRASYAARHYSLNLSSACFFRDFHDLRAMLWDMIFNYNQAESISLARNICRFAQDYLSARIIGVKEARFEVLRGTRMPAVLIEVGFLSNYREEQLLRDGAYREKLSLCIMDGIVNYAKENKEREYPKR